MKIAAHRGNPLHAPENSLLSFISAYTSGAGVLEMDVQLTKDEELVVSHDGTVNRLTGKPAPDVFIKDLTLKELRWGDYDFSETFNPHQVAGFQYYRSKKRLQIERFPDLLDQLPADVDLLIELKHDSTQTDAMRTTLVQKCCEVIRNRGLQPRVVLYSKDKLALRLVRQIQADVRVAVFDWELSPDAQLQLLLDEKADGLVTDVDSVIRNQTELTDFGKQLQQVYQQHALKVGLVLYPYRKPGVITQTEFETLRSLDGIFSVSTDTLIGTNAGGVVTAMDWIYPQYDWLTRRTFEGTEVDRDWIALGYAKANSYCQVFQKDGIRVELKPYDGFLPLPADPDPVKDRLNKLELRLMYAEKSWPFYSGGGLAVIRPLEGDFIATVDYEMQRPMSQAQTLEMAITNVDPAAHRDKPPVTFRDSDAFYDPHGCPPYVGVEHDEDDGYRINWNLGSDYDNNQYGSPVGDGAKPISGTLRLERRGQYFSAYYRNPVDAPYWICVGVVKNATLNDRIFLRCVAKRWLQEREDDPSAYYPVEANTFTFKNLHITKPIK